MKKFLLTLLLLFSLGFAASAANPIEMRFGSSNWGETSDYVTTTSIDGKWTFVNFNNNKNSWKSTDGTPIIKCGRKSAASVAQLQTAQPLEAEISKVVLHITEILASNSVNSVKLKIADNASFSNATEIKANEATVVAGDVTFTIAAPEANKYYSVVIDCPKSGNSKNGFVSVSGVDYYYNEGGDTPDPTPDAPVISAATGDVVYAEGETASNEVVKGTEVTFSVSNYTEVLATFGDTVLDDTDFVDGIYTATITADAKMEIIAYNGDIDATHVYNFTVKEEVTPNPPATDENKYTITFKGNGASQDSSTALTTSSDLTNFVESGLEYISNISETAYTYHSTVGIRLSSGKNAGKIKFALNDAGKLKATKIVVSAKVYNKDTNVTLSVNGTSKSVTGSEFTDITYDLAGNTLEYIELAAEANKRVHVNGITVYYAKEEEPEFELVGISHNPHFNKTNVVYSYTLHVNNHIEGRDSYEAVLTVNGQEFRNTEHTLATDASAENAMLREQTFNSTHKLNGIVKATGLDGDTEYAANFAVLHNGTEIYSEPVENFKTGTVGIEDVTVDGNEAAEYFNLQGVRVAQPEAGRVYIVRRGAKATKELVK